MEAKGNDKPQPGVCANCHKPVRAPGHEYCCVCRRRLEKENPRGTKRLCARCGRPILNRGFNQYCAACRRVEDYEKTPYVSQNGEEKRPTRKRQLAAGPRELLAQKDYRQKRLRRCHDCGKPTANYRCDACWQKLRKKLGLAQDGEVNIAEGWD